MDEVLLLPAALLLGWLAVVDFRPIFYILMAAIPISIEFNIGSFGTDLPSEPLMWLLFLVSIFWFLKNWKSVDGRFLRHGLTILLFAHLGWMFFTVVISQDFVVSLKFFLAKIWYVVVFYFLAGHLLDSEKDYKKLVWAFFIPLIFTVLRVLVRHAPSGFSFETTNYCMGPFYRNHVMYACVLAIFLPYLWFATYWYRRFSWPWFVLVLGIAVLLVGINFAYTRAAYVALVVAILAYWCIRRKILKTALLVFGLAASLFVGWVTSRDNFMLFAPDFQNTVTHKTFDNLLEATTKLEDISIMERVYRWVAASYMISERPLTGYGPGTFYFFYKKFTVTSFKTYVSDNPEKSGIHCYYLMTMVEQGVFGIFIFLILTVSVMLFGQKIYHQTHDPARRRMAVAATLSFILIALLMLMNDFVETDKIGSFFFIAMAILVNVDLGNRKSGQTPANF